MNALRNLAISGLALTNLSCGEDQPENSSSALDVREELELREELDRTVWADETEAQRHEKLFVELWDAIRSSADKFGPLEKFVFSSLAMGEPGAEEELDLGVHRLRYSDAMEKTLNRSDVLEEMAKLKSKGFEIIETEWHHSQFIPAKDGPPKSVISATLHVRRDLGATLGEDRFIVRTNLHVTWDPAAQEPVPGAIEAKNTRILHRKGAKPGFVERLTVSKGQHPSAVARPLILNDLDGDGLSEIIVPRWNAIFRNGGNGKFTRENITPHAVPHKFCSIIADFTGDGLPDLFSVSAVDHKPMLFIGTAGGHFADEARPCSSVEFENPSAVTAGDVDGDGDLDLWVGQYKDPYTGGQMPTPYYDANDGHPSYLLLNDGKGSFQDATIAAGLEAKRHRRTYSNSLVDLDDDGDLDLMVVSDFAGIDLYRNDGTGKFTDATAEWVGPRHSFGMGHVLDDFDMDGAQDFYVIGMSSTTARRLDLLNLSRDDAPDISAKRSEMGYGNRMYLGRGDRYQTPEFAASVARTGWSWGVTSIDFDNDGDRDIYVANGHQSGESSQDYCSTYWRHDIYTGTSEEDSGIESLLALSVQDLNAGAISWNGHEKNALLNNLGGKDFVDVAFLLGVSFSYDAREVVSDDLDADGRPDLLVGQSVRRGHGDYETTFFGYRNEVETANRWIGVRLRDEGPGRSPIGAKVAVYGSRGIQRRQIVTGDSYRSQHANILHFGLGSDGEVERIEVIWPNGERSEIESPALNQYHRVPPPDSQ